MSKQIRAWLQMEPYADGQPWSRPPSDTSYLKIGDIFSAIHPVHGGSCDASGNWVQRPSLYQDATVRDRSRYLGNLYMPTVNITSKAAFEALLVDPAARATAVANLANLATARSDGPWDGVDFDVETIDDSLKDNLTAFFDEAATALRSAGLAVNITATASDRDSGLAGPGRHVFDFSALASIADTITVMLYTSFGMNPNTSPGPYDQSSRVLAYIVGKGVPPDNLYAGLSIASRYIDTPMSAYTSYANAQAIMSQAGVSPSWYEANDDGKLFRFRHAAWDGREMWVIDADTLKEHLRLVDIYDLGGICLFVPGSERSNIWDMLRQWKLPVAGTTGVRCRRAQIYFSDWNMPG